MKKKVPSVTNQNEVPASLSSESPDRIAGLVVAKLIVKNQIAMPSE